MTGWKGSLKAAFRVCGVRPSSLFFLAMIAFHYSDERRRLRPWLAGHILKLAGAPDPITLDLRRPTCRVWIRPFDAGDVQSFREVFIDRIYPTPDGGTVLDAGANIGFYSVLALEEGDAKRVVAIEPEPMNHRLLRRNLAHYGSRVKVIQAALWSEEGEAPFVSTGQSNWGHVTSSTGVEPASRGVIEVRTVSPESEELPPAGSIDYLKLDIEGAEDEVIDHYLEHLPEGAVLSGELHGRETIRRYRESLGERWQLVEEAPTYLTFNWVAGPRDG